MLWEKLVNKIQISADIIGPVSDYPLLNKLLDLSS